jgi:hypothetical protein
MDHAERRVSHAVPTKKYRLSLNAKEKLSQPLCVTFTDQAWRP